MRMKARTDGSMRPWYGWSMVAAGFLLAFFLSGFVHFGFTAVIEPISEEFGWSYSTVSLAASLRGLEMGILAPFLGFLVDRWGPRRLIVAGAGVTGLGLLGLSQVASLPAFYASFVLIAFGVSACVGVVPVTAVNSWFDDRATLATAILVSGTAAGGLLIPLATWLIDSLGWQTAMAVYGVASWLLLVPLGLVFRHRPERYGHVPYRRRPSVEAQYANGGGPSPPAGASRGSAGGRTLAADRPGTGVRQALRGRAFWHVAVAMMLHFLAVTAVVTHVMPYLGSIGIARGVASFVASAIPLASALGRLSFGALGDRVDKRMLAAAGLALTGVALVVFGAAAGQRGWLLAPFVLLMGLGYGGPVPILPALIRGYYGRARLGAMLGLTLGAAAVGGVAGPPLAGWVFDRFGDYQIAWFVLGALMSLGFVSMLSAPRIENLAAPAEPGGEAVPEVGFI